VTTPNLTDVVIIEYVSKLVCRALFDIGKKAKVFILSVRTGEDKPVKYPHIFCAAPVMIINKTDLLAYVDFNVDRCIKYARSVNPDINVLQLSATDGNGLKNGHNWLSEVIQFPTGLVAEQ